MVAVIDYGVGNLFSLLSSLKAIGADAVITNDVDTIGWTLNQSVSSLVSALTMLIGSVIMMFKTNWIMALTAIFSSLLGFMLMTTILKHSQKYFSKVQNANKISRRLLRYLQLL